MEEAVERMRVELERMRRRAEQLENAGTREGPMQPDRFTVKSQEAVMDALKLASRLGNPEAAPATC